MVSKTKANGRIGLPIDDHEKNYQYHTVLEHPGIEAWEAKSRAPLTIFPIKTEILK